MNEGERIRLYNDLCDYEEDLRNIAYPSQSRSIDIIHRATVFVRGVLARWICGSTAMPILNENKQIVHYINCECSSCHFVGGDSTFHFCPNCGARMKR